MDAHEEKQTGPIAGFLRGMAGAIVGGALGYWIFLLLRDFDFYATVVPGGLAAIACGALSGRRSLFLGFLCALISVALTIVAEWRYAPYCRNMAWSYFLDNLGHFKPFTYIMLTLSAGLGFFFGWGQFAHLKTVAKKTSEADGGKTAQ